MTTTESFIVAIKESPNGTILVITDPDLIDQKFEDERFQLDLSKKFYQGELIDSEKLAKMIDGSYVLHITGKKAIEFVSSQGFIDANKVLTICDIPHAQAYLGE